MLKIGIIGLGKMGQIRVDAILKSGQAVIDSIYDPDYDVTLPFNSVDSAEDIINNQAIDAVFICTPNYLNAPLTIKALKSGKHVFCEKPPTMNLDELEEVKSENQRTDSILMYGFNHRYHESIIKMKSLVDSGSFGKVIWMRGRYGKSVDKTFFDSWRAKRKYSGGGIVIDQGIHMLDLFLLFANDFDSIHASLTNKYWGLDIEDNAFVTLENTKNNISASLHSTMTQWRHLFSLEVFLEKGYMVLNGLKTSSNSYGEETLTIARNRTKPPSAEWEDETHERFPIDKSWQFEVDEFFAAIKDKRKASMGNINDAIKVMTIIKEIYSFRDKG
jgi:1,5-anhydro-D-fructose reductase (1,5-anhydro-D-mannitol-forming)